MTISGINNNSYSSYSSYGKIASGNRIQSAADDAAGLGIAQGMNRQETGLNVGSNNQASGRDLLNIQDGALGNITDNLQRIRELALQAQNTVSVTATDRANIQKEIDGLKQGIADIASQTTFNTKNILDGTQGTMQLATDSNGNATSINSNPVNATLDALGISDFDVTRNSFNIDAIDKALEQVTSMRSEGGAQTNRLSYGINVNNYSAFNTTASRSRIQDLDIPTAVSEQKKQQNLNNYAMMMQRRKMEDARNNAQRLFGGL